MLESDVQATADDHLVVIHDTCADGVMAAFPSVLEEVLEQRGVERP